MSRYLRSTMLLSMYVASATFAMAQTPQPPPSDTEPSSASSPHQQQTMHDQMMKDCMKKGHKKDSSMSKDELKKSCQDQMKTQGQPKN